MSLSPIRKEENNNAELRRKSQPLEKLETKITKERQRIKMAKETAKSKVIAKEKIKTKKDKPAKKVVLLLKKEKIFVLFNFNNIQKNNNQTQPPFTSF